MINNMKIVARAHSEFPSKFGIPRQSGLASALRTRIVFEPEFRNVEALRGIEEFSHLWLIWDFSEAHQEQWSPTVRPPRLGGNRRMGVFATRSPFRPNPIGLSCVKLLRVEQDAALGPVLYVAGADLMDGTPIYDIKPYIPYADCHPEATGGFTVTTEMPSVEVHISPELLRKVPEEKREALIGVLSQDPRPRYQNTPERTYAMGFAGMTVRFTVDGGTLTVRSVEKGV